MIKPIIRLLLASVVLLALSGCYSWKDERHFRNACYANGGTPEFNRTRWGITYGMKCRLDER
jgi:hypothetical protein